MSPRTTPRENFLMATGHKGPDWLPCPIFDSSVVTVGHGITERAKSGVDSWGVIWESRDARSDSFPVAHPLISPASLADFDFPVVDEETFASGRQTVSRADRSEVIIMGDNGWGLFERAWLLLGMQRFFQWCYRFPDALEHLLDEIATVKLALTEGLVEELGVDVVAYGDDWGMEDRLLMPRGTWDRFIKPRQSELYGAAKRGGSMVYQHSDGKVEAVIPEIIEMGADIVNVQRECNDWETIMARYGCRVTLWGGVSARTLDLGSDEEIAREVRRCCVLGQSGGVILAPGHALKYSAGKIEVMRDAWRRFGGYRRGTK